ncbi:MAG: hypothetical protein ACYDER_01165 [Ktedonobacteraceae bacterium]
MYLQQFRYAHLFSFECRSGGSRCQGATLPDIYYEEATPDQVTAIQLYDKFGDPTAKYTTPTYDQNPNTYQKPGVGPGVGEVIMALGLILAGIGGYLMYMQRRNGFV